MKVFARFKQIVLMSLMPISLVAPALLMRANYFDTSIEAKAESNNNGLIINGLNDRYSMTQCLDQTIRTYEAWVDTYETGVNQGSTIFANYSDEWMPGISFRIYTYNSKIGQPQLNLRYSKSGTSNAQLQYNIPVNICGTGRRHVAFTLSNSQIKGYLDGVLKKTWAYNGVIPEAEVPWSVGGDERPNNTWWFRGSIYSLSVYNRVRTASEIASDMNSSITKTSDLIAGWNFSSSLSNVANDGNELTRHFYDKEFIDPNDYDYTFAVIGDTQSLMYNYPEEFHSVYDCLLEKKNEMNIKLAIGLGDITEKNLDYEWIIARNEIYRLSGEMPFTLVRGNHDLSNYGGLSDEWREVKFGQYFNNDTYRKELTGLYQNSVENTYKTLSVNGIDYLILMLDYGPSDDVLNWADEVVESYPSYNVIVTTHAFLFRDGTTLDSTDLVPPAAKWGYNNGDDVWNKFIKKHNNIVMVLSGHDPFPEIVRSEMVGDNGNIINSLLIDPQYIDNYYGAYGLIAFFHFSNGGKDISIEYCSSVTGEFFKPINQFSFSLDKVDSSNQESRSLPGMIFESAEEINDGDLISISYFDTNINKSIGFDGEDFIEVDNVFHNGYLAENSKRLVFEVEKTSDKYALKTLSGKYLSFLDEEPILLNDPDYYLVSIVDDNFNIKKGERSLSYSNGFVLSDTSSFIHIYKYSSFDSNPLESALRYFERFNNSFVCGFDANTSASSIIFGVLFDDYDRLNQSVKNKINELIQNDDYRAHDFIEKYQRIIQLHGNEEGFDNFLNLQISKINSLGILEINYLKKDLTLIVILFCFLVVIPMFYISIKRKTK